MNLNLQDPKLIVIAAAVIVIIALIAWMIVRNKRRNTTADLRQKFGPEYDRAVLTHGSERKAEATLEDRKERVERLNLRDLDRAESENFSRNWQSVQSRFVDSPEGAVAEADDLVSSVMKARGYPVTDFEQRRYFCRSSPRRGKLQGRPCHRSAGWQGPGHHRRAANIHDSLSLFI